MFCTAEAAGGTLILLPEARYKTSFYSMLGRVGQTRKDVGRAYPHRIPLARLKGMSEKRRSELAGRLRISREASERDYNPLPCPLPTSPWCGK